MGGGEILKKGWLIKSPPLEGGGIKSWRKRLFCLRSSKVLEYYKTEDGDLKGVINLEDCHSVNSDLFHKKYKYVFNIETKDRTYFLVASSQELMMEWVNAVCKVCNFLQFETNDTPAPKNAMTLPVSSNPQQGIAFTERFKPVENGRTSTSDDLYSLAVAAEYDVQRQLSREQEVPPGTPLSEALASKKMGSKQRSGSLSSHTSNSSTSGSDATSSRLSGISDTSYFTPRPADSPGFLSSLDPHTLYASPPNNASLLPGGPPQAKPRSATLMPTLPSGGYNHLTPSGSPQQGRRSLTNVASADVTLGTFSNSSEGGADTMENGYMRPRPTLGRVPDYDYPPLGPPRPANADQGNTSPRQHRSALLKNDRERVVPPTPPNSLVDSGNTPFGGLNAQYINMQELLEGLPAPPVDRTKKPAPLLAPRIDRSLKPTGESPPDFPTRTDSVSGNTSGDESDIPKLTKRSTCYTQVQFDPATRRPIPLPRTSQPKPGAGQPGAGQPGAGQPGAGQPKPGAGVRRVNYSDVDLEATKVLADKMGMSSQPSLRRAENEALAEKYYINVNRTGSVDDDTNPDYYTHMRNFTFEEADKPAYYTTRHQQRPEPRET